MTVIDLIVKKDIACDIELCLSHRTADIGTLIFPPSVVDIDVVIKNIKVNHSVSCENTIVADTFELTADMK